MEHESPLSSLSFVEESPNPPEDKGDQINLKDKGLFTLIKLVLTTRTPLVGGLSLPYKYQLIDLRRLLHNQLNSVYSRIFTNNGVK